MVYSSSWLRQRDHFRWYVTLTISSSIHKPQLAQLVLPHTGTAVGGLVLPIVEPRLMSAYGTSSTLRILGIAMTIMLVPLLPFLKGRLPNIRQAHGPTPRSQHSLLSLSFMMLMLVNTVQSLAYFTPIVWLPSRSPLILIVRHPN